MFEPKYKHAEDQGGSHTTLFAHGDGTLHTISDQGVRKDHASIGAALMHLAKKHSDGDHVHVHGHETGYTSHQVKEGGKVEGPLEHKGIGDLKRSLSKFLDEEAQEG